MKKISRRFIIFILTFLLTVLPLIACSETGDSPPDTEAAAPTETDSAPEDSLAARALVSDGLPEADYGGETFTIITQTMTAGDAYVEQETGDVVSDEIYLRNGRIQERFNITIGCYDAIYADCNAAVEKSVIAGDNAYQLLYTQAVATGELLIKNLLNNWYNVPYIDFDKSWWAGSTVDDLTYNNKAYSAIGDFSLSAMYATYCMFYDKVAAAEYGINDVYNIVSDGKWTVDRLHGLTKDVYRDLNGDGKRDIDDYYGFSSDSYSNMLAYIWAFDNPIMVKNSEGIPEFRFKTEKINTIFEKLQTLCYESEGSYLDPGFISPEGYPQDLSREMFKKGSVMFGNGYFRMALTHFRDVENDYGIIPYPKFDEAQQRYQTMADGFHGVLAAPKTIANPEMLGIITEALCAETWKSVQPVYYDVALKVKGARDEESIEMIDLIMEGRVFDFGYIYDNWQGICFKLIPLFQKDAKQNFESLYAANEKAVSAHYNKIIEIFDTLD